MFKTAIIMAGGKGTRMFPVSDYVPKPLIKVRGKTLIDHCIDNLYDKGIDQIYVTYGYKSEMLVSHIEKKVDGLINTIEQDNAYCIFNTIISNINESIIVMPCDILMSFNFNKIYKETSDGTMGMSYILPVLYKDGMNADFLKNSPSPYNDLISDIGRHFSSNYCASGIQIINPYQLNQVIKHPTENWYDVWIQLIKQKLLMMTKNPAENWETYDKLEQLLDTK